MSDAYELLRQKEAELKRVRHEIEALQIAAPLLSDDTLPNDLPEKKATTAERQVGPVTPSPATGTDNLFSSIAPSRPSFWKGLKRGK